MNRRIAELYREALASQAEPGRSSRSLPRINAWLVENRPHWLDNVLVRYDYEALYWVQKARLFADASQQYSLMKKLPEPEKLGLHLP